MLFSPFLALSEKSNHITEVETDNFFPLSNLPKENFINPYLSQTL